MRAWIVFLALAVSVAMCPAQSSYEPRVTPSGGSPSYNGGLWNNGTFSDPVFNGTATFSGSSSARFLFAAMAVNNDNLGLLIATSKDGKNVDISGGTPVYENPASQVQLRDPSIIRHPATGIYYVVHTINAFDASQPQKFALLSSADLVHWTLVDELDLSADFGISGTTRIWAPDLFVDDNGMVYVVFSCTTRSGGTYPWDGQIFYVASAAGTDLTTWNAAVALTGTAFPTPAADAHDGAIDAQIFKKDGLYKIIYLDIATNYNIVASGTAVTGPYTVEHSGDFAGMGANREGCSVVQLGEDAWRIYFINKSSPAFMQYVDTTDDWATWSIPANVSSGLTSLNHGTVIRTNEDAVLRDINWAAGFHRNNAATSLRAVFSNTNITVTAANRYVAQTGTLSAARTVTLPLAASFPTDQTLTIADESRTASESNTINIVRSSTNTVNSGTMAQIVEPGGTISLRSNGTNSWFYAVPNQQFTGSNYLMVNQVATGSASVMTRALTGVEPFFNLAVISRPVGLPSLGSTGGGAVAAADSAGDSIARLSSGTATSGYGRASFARGLNTAPGLTGGTIDFTRRLGVNVRALLLINSGNATSCYRLVVGGAAGVPAAADADALSTRGFGIEVRYVTSTVQWRVFVHNGTTYGTSAWQDTGLASLSGTQVTTFGAISSGAGSVTGYYGAAGTRNLSSVTVSGGPTAATGAGAYAEIVAVNPSTGTPVSLSVRYYDSIILTE